MLDGAEQPNQLRSQADDHLYKKSRKMKNIRP
jgi:hypothetical protein